MGHLRIRGVGPLPQLRSRDQRRYVLAQESKLDRLLLVIRSPLLNRLNGGFCGVVRRHQNDFNGGVEADDLPEDFQPAHPRHHQVGNDQPRTMPAHQFQAFHGIGGCIEGGAGLGKRLG